jgi:hypothetical protein
MIENLFTFVRTLGNQRIEGKKFFVTQVGLLGTVSDNSGSTGTAGKVLSSTGSGVSWITVGTGNSNVDVLDDLSDVIISTATEGQLLRFNGTSWVNWAPNFLTDYGSLNDLSDVSVSNPDNGQILRYNDTTNLWYADDEATFATPSLDAVTDVGSTTTNSITVGNLSTSGTVTSGVVTTPLIQREGVLTINSQEQVDQGDPNPNLLYVSWLGDNKFVINADGYAISSTGYKVVGGTASGFLKADGTIDTSAYITANSVDTLLNKTIALGTGIYQISPIDDISGFAGQSNIPIYQDGINKGGTINIDGQLAISVSNPGIGYYTGTVTTVGGTRFAISVNGNTLTGTLAEFNVALTDGSFATEYYVDTQIEYIDNIGDVNLVSPATGDVLTFDGTEWVNSPIDSAAYVSKVQHEVKAGVAITKGQALYVTGADGTNMIVGLASNVSEATSSKTIGLAAASAAVNGKFFVVTEGLLDGLNTSTATAGDAVWLGVNGALIFGLINKPVTPAHLVYIGVVTRSNANNGEIFISIQNGFELNELHDVDVQSAVDGYVLTAELDEVTEKIIWKAKETQSTDKHYTYNQNSASAQWTITHNLGKNPSISVVDSAGTEVIGQVYYVSLNQLIVYFTEPFSGKAYLN